MRRAPEVTDDAEDSAPRNPQRSGRTATAPASTAIAGVVAAAAGATAIPQLLGLFANIAQVATLASSDVVFVANIVIVALGLIALFGPGQSRYRASIARVIATACAVIVCGTFAGIGLNDRLTGQPAPAGAATPGPAPSGPPVGVPVAATSDSPAAAPATSAVAVGPGADPGTGPGRPQPRPGKKDVTAGPVTAPRTRPPAPKVGVSAAMACTPSSCETSEKIMSLGGAFRGTLASGHQLMLFVQAPDGRHYPGSTGLVSDGRWSGKVHVGSDNGQEASYTYAGCLYDIDQTFAADLDARGDSELNQGLTRVPTSGTAVRLACAQLRWNRP